MQDPNHNTEKRAHTRKLRQQYGNIPNAIMARCVLGRSVGTQMSFQTVMQKLGYSLAGENSTVPGALRNLASKPDPYIRAVPMKKGVYEIVRPYPSNGSESPKLERDQSIRSVRLEPEPEPEPVGKPQAPLLKLTRLAADAERYHKLVALLHTLDFDVSDEDIDGM